MKTENLSKFLYSSNTACKNVKQGEHQTVAHFDQLIDDSYDKKKTGEDPRLSVFVVVALQIKHRYLPKTFR